MPYQPNKTCDPAVLPCGWANKFTFPCCPQDDLPEGWIVDVGVPGPVSVRCNRCPDIAGEFTIYCINTTAFSNPVWEFCRIWCEDSFASCNRPFELVVSMFISGNIFGGNCVYTVTILLGDVLCSVCARPSDIGCTPPKPSPFQRIRYKLTADENSPLVDCTNPAPKILTKDSEFLPDTVCSGWPDTITVRPIA